MKIKLRYQILSRKITYGLMIVKQTIIVRSKGSDRTVEQIMAQIIILTGIYLLPRTGDKLSLIYCQVIPWQKFLIIVQLEIMSANYLSYCCSKIGKFNYIRNKNNPYLYGSTQLVKWLNKILHYASCNSYLMAVIALNVLSQNSRDLWTDIRINGFLSYAANFHGNF